MTITKNTKDKYWHERAEAFRNGRANKRPRFYIHRLQRSS